MFKVCILKRKEKNRKYKKKIPFCLKVNYEVLSTLYKNWYNDFFFNEHRSKKGKLCFLKLIYTVYSCLHMALSYCNNVYDFLSFRSHAADVLIFSLNKKFFVQ